MPDSLFGTDTRHLIAYAGVAALLVVIAVFGYLHLTEKSREMRRQARRREEKRRKRG